MAGQRKAEARRWFQQALYDLKAVRWNKVVLPEVARKIDSLLKRPGSPEKEITVPVYSLS